MVFEGDSLKGYRIDSVNNKVIKIDLPNVEERKQGKWIDKGQGIFNSFITCSCCGKRSIDQTTYVPMNFCPNCGAEMDANE